LTVLIPFGIVTGSATQRDNKMATQYKGYTIAKYLNANNGVRWSVEKDGEELMIDQTKKYLCTRYIDSLTRGM